MTPSFIKPTLSFIEAGDQLWDAIVIGAGPAGATAAREIARRGASVLLVDKAQFPRSKVCGCCLNGPAQDALNASGLGDLVKSLGAVDLHHFEFAVAGERAVVPLHSNVSLSRESFDAALVREAIASGASFLPSSQAAVGDTSGDFRQITLTQNELSIQAKAKIVIAADGLSGSSLARIPEFTQSVSPDSRIGAGTTVDLFPAFYEPGRIYMACGKGGYVGLVRLEDGRLDIAAALDPNVVRSYRGPAEAAQRILAESGLPLPDELLTATWRGTARLTSRRRTLASNRVLVIGDAASYAEPFTGQGIAWALTAGSAVAPLALAGAISWSAAQEKQWHSLHSSLIRNRQHFSGIIAMLLRRSELTRIACLLLSVYPDLAKPVMRQINAP